METKADYVSVWDDVGEVRTLCDYNPTTGKASNIQHAETLPEGVLEREYVETFDGQIIDTFTDEDNGREIVNGEYQEPA